MNVCFSLLLRFQHPCTIVKDPLSTYGSVCFTTLWQGNGLLSKEQMGMVPEQEAPSTFKYVLKHKWTGAETLRHCYIILKKSKQCKLMQTGLCVGGCLPVVLKAAGSEADGGLGVCVQTHRAHWGSSWVPGVSQVLCAGPRRLTSLSTLLVTICSPLVVLGGRYLQSLDTSTLLWVDNFPMSR